MPWTAPARDVLHGLNCMIVRCIVCFCTCLLLCSCVNLLPRDDSEQPSGFDSFEAAAQVFDKIVAYRTTVEQLRALGFDLQSSPNVTLISYPQLTGRLAPDRGVPFEAIGPGIRDCILARLHARRTSSNSAVKRHAVKVVSCPTSLIFVARRG